MGDFGFALFQPAGGGGGVGVYRCTKPVLVVAAATSCPSASSSSSSSSSSRTAAGAASSSASLFFPPVSRAPHTSPIMQDDDLLIPDRTTGTAITTTISSSSSAVSLAPAPALNASRPTSTPRSDRRLQQQDQSPDPLTKRSHQHPTPAPPPQPSNPGEPPPPCRQEEEELEEERTGDRDALASTDACGAAAAAAVNIAERSHHPQQQPHREQGLMEATGNMTAAGGGGGGGGGIGMLPGLAAGFQQQQQLHQQQQEPGPGGSSSAGGSSSNGSSPSPVAALTGFGTAWSPAPAATPAQMSTSPGSGGGGVNAPGPCSVPSPADDSFFHSIPSINGTVLFQNFAANTAGVGHGYGGTFSPLPQQQQNRRSPVGLQHHHHPQHQHQAAFPHQRSTYSHHQPIMKQSPWNSHQSSGWSAGVSWGGMQTRDHRRTGGVGMPTTMNQISPLKKPFSSNIIAPPKFPRSAPTLTPKSWIEDNVFRTDNNSNTLLPLQDRTRLHDSLNMISLENSLIDIMRAEQDPLKGRLGYPHPGTDNFLMLNGRSSLFPIEDGFLDDGHGDQTVPGVLNSVNCCSSHQNGERIERYSRKVFVGGLPPDIDEDEITASFRRFGPLVVDWPHKAESKSYFPPKGYAFLLFQEESSVQALIDACIEEDGKLYLCVSSPTIKDKPVQIRPWNLSDSDFVMDGSQPLDPRKTIFVGGVPRPLRAVELAMIMDRLYGGVCYAGIDTDPELKYPKGAGRVAFSNQQSYIAAISARFVQLQHGDIDKRVEVKPYVLDDQMCDECQGARCGGKFAPFFCANVTCLQYYCEFCWANIHSRAGREFHKPLVKEGADRPRQVHFRWS
ncbi:cytoplasmic polyadenylation element-binding protein 2-like isoform X2 [Pristis pectinata]|uniref:cytoplasmic polyadenylation element-binding protein 2-like isoform X2 n=1 Tax=Pristis pectinata TaxID=685728 RepID=UPI00223C8DB2|nr:cytoplasmic polyadenylation element-binding protein 2-like isoform X2 [Pristis pectinata]